MATKEGYLVRIAEVHERGWGKFRVIHSPKGRRTEEYDQLWGVHPDGGFDPCGENPEEYDPREEHSNKDDRFALKEKIAD